MSRALKNYAAVLDAIHHFEREDGHWLAGIVDAAVPVLGFGSGAIACAVNLDAAGTCVSRTIRSSGVRGSVRQRWLGDRRWQACLAPTPPATTLRRIAAGTADDPTLTAELRRGRDALVLRGTAANGRGGVAIVAPSSSRIRLSGRRQRTLDRIAAELAAAYRLRATLSGRDPFAVAADVLSLIEGGHQVSEPDAARDGAVVRPGSPADAAEVWLALLAGHWRAVDHRDHDGKRLVLVVANSAGAQAPLALAAQEREVLVKTAAGYPLKEVAYELGVGASTVSALLRSALRKFRLASPSEAVRLFSTTGV